MRDALIKLQRDSANDNSNRQAELENAKQDGARLASSLEKVVNSHSQLQSTVEELKRELGQKVRVC